MDSNKDASISALVNSAITDAQSLVRSQIELAKAEVTQSAKQAAGASGLLIGAAVLAFLAFVFALVAGELLNGQHLPRGDPVLLSACFNDCVHDRILIKKF